MANGASADEARARFEAVARAQLSGELVAGVRMELVDAAAWADAHAGLWEQASERSHGIDVGALASEEERAAVAGLDALLAGELEHRVVLRAGDDVVGAYWGRQESFGRYHMVFSVVHPAWQRRGLYRALLARVMAATAASGFREVYSRHRADNNAVIIPKLAAGFAISGFEIAPRYGLLVHLRWYPSDAMRLAFQYRVDGSHAAALRALGCNLP
jgi:L-amino acid N-acyltransferase YncA